MKTIQQNLVPSILAILFIAVSAGSAMAYDHDKTGWYDNQHQHHAYIQHNGHQGYWDHNKSGVLIFISI
jgi:hypothetical protein